MQAAKSAISVGMRFRSAASTAGSQTVGAWQVVEIFRGSDGLEYAQLRNEADSSRVKSVACRALLDRKLYNRAPAG